MRRAQAVPAARDALDGLTDQGRDFVLGWLVAAHPDTVLAAVGSWHRFLLDRRSEVGRHQPDRVPPQAGDN